MVERVGSARIACAVFSMTSDWYGYVCDRFSKVPR